MPRPTPKALADGSPLKLWRHVLRAEALQSAKVCGSAREGKLIFIVPSTLKKSGSNNILDNRFNPVGIDFVNIGLPKGSNLIWGTADDGLRPVFGSSTINA